MRSIRLGDVDSTSTTHLLAGEARAGVPECLATGLGGPSVADFGLPYVQLNLNRGNQQ